MIARFGMTWFPTAKCGAREPMKIRDRHRPLLFRSISQRIGITDITISYQRPLVNDRKVWDDLVPYGKVWRAGANENTRSAQASALPIYLTTHRNHRYHDQLSTAAGE